MGSVGTGLGNAWGSIWGQPGLGNQIGAGGSGDGLGTGRAGLDAAQTQGLDTSRSITNNLNALQPQQQAFAEQLAKNAMGQGTSIANAQLQSAMNHNLQQQMGMAKANRAVNPALANRQLGNQAATVQRDTANAGVTARLQEQQAQQGAFQNYITSQQNAGANYLGAGTTAAAQNAQAQQSQQQMKQDQMAGMLNMGSSMMSSISDERQKKNIKYYADGGMVLGGEDREGQDGSLQQAAELEQPQPFTPAPNPMALTQQPQQQPVAAPQIAPSQLTQLQALTSMPLIDKTHSTDLTKTYSQQGSGGGKGGGLMAMFLAQGGKVPGQAPVSGDSRTNDIVDAKLSPGEIVVPRSVVAGGKKAITAFVNNIKETKSAKLSDGGKVADNFDPKSFLDALQAASYDYKNPSKPGAGEGRHLSVMAQDLENAGPVGKSMVQTGQDGTKSVDYAKGFGAILASQASLNERLAALEKAKGGKRE